MTRVLSFLLSLLLLAGSGILPGGDFGIIWHLSSVYNTFVRLNGPVSFDEFLAEELLDPYLPPDDGNEPGEPFEKEMHTVPFDLISLGATGTCFTVSPALVLASVNHMESFFLPIIKWQPDQHLRPVFHPPEC